MLQSDAHAALGSEAIHPTEVAGLDGSFVHIPDAHFLFHADFKRTGSDLTLTGEDGHRVIVPDYFKHELLPTLLSPEGASITGDIVEALAGSRAAGQYAQAGGTAAPEVIGRVATAQGAATAVRNGATVTLNVGDAVYKGDVIQTAADSAVGVVFNDSTTFNLSANARMVLNEFVYTPGGASNSALINLVQGSIAFVAGEVAHTGDMKVGTPVATMGIRGTAVSVDISADNGTTQFSVMVEPNGQVGSFNLLDKTTGQIIGTVSNSSVGWVVSPQGPLQVLAQEFQKPADMLAREFLAVQAAFNIQSQGLAIINNAAPQQPQQNPNSGSGNGSSTPPPVDNKQPIDIKPITINSFANSGSDKSDAPIIVPPPIHVVLDQQQQQGAAGNPAPFFISPGLVRVPVPAGGLHGANDAIGPVISADGRYVAFESASQLPTQSNGSIPGGDIYLFDRQSNTTLQLTHATGNGTTYDGVSISSDGRYVVYQSHPLNGQSAIYVYDRVNNTTAQVHSGGNAHIDGAGNLIAMEGQAANNTNGVLVTDLSGHVLTDVSANNGGVWSPQIDADGRLITFYSSATQITINGHTFNENSGGQDQVYVYDRSAGTLKMISVSGSGQPGDGNSGAVGADGSNDWPSSISADGRYVTFQSSATNLVPGDNNGSSDIFVRDLITGTTQRVSVGETHTGNYVGQGIFQVNTATAGNQQASSVAALADGGFLATWSDATGVFSQRYDVNGNAVGAQVHVNSQAAAAQPGAEATGLSNGGYVVTWTSASGQVHGQLYTAGGQASQGEFTINTETVNAESHPDVVALSDGGFFVSWTSTGSGANGADIHGQRFDASGAVVGNEITINTTVAGSQVDPAITLLSSGGFVVAWTSTSSVPGGGTAIIAQSFDSNGAASGAQFQIDTSHPTNNQSQPAISALVGGGFVVTWTATGVDGSGDGVYAERFDASGRGLGVVQVNTTTAGNQNDATVTSLQTGGYVVTWTTLGAAGLGTVVHGQQFDALGSPVNAEFAVTPPASFNQTDAKLTTLPNGNVVVTWTSQDGSGSTGISGEVFSDLVATQANGASYRPVISQDGRYVTFSSDATNLVTGDTNVAADTFIYDRVTETIQRVSASGSLQSFGDSNLGDAVSNGGSIVTYGGVAIEGLPQSPSVQGDNKTVKFSAQISDIGGTDPLTLTLHVSHGKLSGSLTGLTIVNNQDGSTGTLVVTGTAAAISAAVQAGVFYTPTGTGNDALTINISDSAGAIFAVSTGFTPAGVEVPPLVFATNAQPHLNGNNTITFSTGAVTTLNPTDHAVTLTLTVQEGSLSAAGNLAGSGLTIVNGLDGSGGILEVTGTLAAVNAALNGGVIYSGSSGFSHDALSISVNDGYTNETQVVAFDNQAHVLSVQTYQEPGVQTSDIYVADRSNGGSGIILDDPVYTSASDPTVPSVAPANEHFAQTATQQLWIDQTHANPGILTIPTTQKWGEVFTVPHNQNDLHSVSLQLSATDAKSGGATFFELKLYQWSASGPVGSAIYDSGKIQIGDGSSGITPTTFQFPLDLPVQADKQYVFEIVGDGNIGLATGAGDANTGLFVQSTTGDSALNLWQAAGTGTPIAIAGDLDFKPALETTGTLSFTDIGADAHSVAVSGNNTWGHLNAFVSTETTATSTTGAVSWAYEVDPNLAATLALGEVHTDTFNVTLIDSGGNTATTSVSVTVVGTNEAPKIISASPAPPSQPISFTGDTGGNGVAAGYLVPGQATSGTLTFKEIDLSDTHTVSATLTGANWTGGTPSFANGANVTDLPPAALAFFQSALTAAIQSDSTWTETGVIHWSLADIPAYLTHFLGQNQTLTLTYTIELDDPHLASDTQTITVAIAHTAPAFIGWIGGAGSDWNSPANWSTGSVPQGGDDVHIPDDEVLASGPYQVSNSGVANAHSVALQTSDASLTNSGTLNIATALTLAAHSTAANSGSLTAASVSLADSSSLSNSNHFTVSGALTADHATLTNSAGDLNAGSAAFTGGTTLTNSATFNVTGAVTADAGGIANTANGQLDAGSVTLSHAATLGNAGFVDVSGAMALQTASVLTNTGIMSLSAALTADHATINNNIGEIDAASSALTSSTLSNAATLHVTGAMTGDGSTIANIANAAINVGSEAFTGGTTFTNDGTLTVGGAVTVDASTITSHSTGSIQALSLTVSDAGTLTNAGHVSAGSASLQTASSFTNTGTVGITNALSADHSTLTNSAGELDAGSLALTAATVSNSAIIMLTSTLSEDGGTFVNAAAGTISAGATTLSDSAGFTNSGTSTFRSSFSASASTVTNNATMNVTGTAAVTGGVLTNAAGATLSAGATALHSAADFINLGTATLGGATQIDTGAILDNHGHASTNAGFSVDSATVHNFSGAEIDVASVTFANGSTLDNAGVLKVTAGGSFKSLSTITNETTGTVDVSGGTLHLQVGITNHGTIQADQTGAVSVESVTVDNSSGSIVATGLGGARLILAGATVSNGAISIANGATMEAAGTGNVLDNVNLTNTGGTITLDAAGALTIQDHATIANGTVSVAAGATLTLNAATITGAHITDSGEIAIAGSSTITGGDIGNGHVTVAAGQTLTLDNVSVTGTSFAEAAPNSVIAVEAGQTLTLTGVTITGGSLNVAAGATLNLVDTHITGTTLSDLGAVNISGTSTVDGFANVIGGNVSVGTGQTLVVDNSAVFGNIANSGTVRVDAGAVASLSGAAITGGVIADSGTINVTGSSSINGAQFAGGALTVSGVTLTLDDTTLTGANVFSTGTVSVDANKALTLSGASLSGGALANSGTVHVTGNSSVTGETVTNNALTVDAGQSLTLNNTQITGGAITDNGAIAITGASPTAIKSAQIGAGTLSVALGSEFDLSAVTLTGGTLNDSGTVVIADSSTFSGVAVNNHVLTIDSGKTLSLSGTAIGGGSIGNGGTISVAGVDTLDGVQVTGGEVSVGSGAALHLAGGASLASGQVDSSGAIELTGNASFTDETVNNSVLTIDAGKTLSLNATTINNGSVGNAGTVELTGNAALNGVTVANNVLTVDSGQTLALTGATVNSGSIGNSGTVSITGADTLNGVAVTGGEVSVGSGAALNLTGGASLASGQVDSFGTIELTGNASFSGETVNNSVLTIDPGKTLTLTSTTINNGSLGNSGTVSVAGTDTLNGVQVTGGEVSVGSAAALHLTGGASLASGQVDSLGTIELTGNASFSGETVNNTSLVIDGMKTLTLSGATIAGGTIDDTTVNFTGGVIDVTGSSTIRNATISNDLTSVENGATLTLDNATVGDATIRALAGGNVALVGTITNQGKIDIDPLTNNTFSNLTINGAVTLTGAGLVTLDSATDLIVAAAPGAVLTNVNNIISGAGVIGLGNNALTLHNGANGIINANGILTIDTGTNSAVNDGLIEVTNGGALHLNSAVTTTANVTTGTVKAVDGTIIVEVAGLADDVIVASTGGVVAIQNSSLGAVAGAAFGAGAVVSATGAASAVTVENGASAGAGSHISATGGASVTLDGGSSLGSNASVTATLGGAFTEDGGSQIGDGAMLSVTGATLGIHGASQFGDGVHVSATGGSDLEIEGGAVLGDGDALTLSSGAVTMNGGALSGTGALAGSLGHVSSVSAISGTLDITGLTEGAVAASTVSAATLKVGAPGTTVILSSAANAGTIEVAANSALDVTGAVTGNGKIQIDAGSTLELGGSDAQTVLYAGAGGLLKIDTANFGGTIVGLAATDQIDLGAIGYDLGSTTASYSGDTSGGILTVTDASGHSIGLHLTGDYTQTYFAGSTDSAGHTLITMKATDDAPVVSDATQSAAIGETAATTGSVSPHTTTGTIHFTDLDLTDRPAASVSAQTVTALQADGHTSLGLSGDEIAALKGAFHIAAVAGANSGSTGWTYSIADDALDFLAAGQTATIISTVTIADQHGDGTNLGTATATVSVTITGTNDLPVLAADAVTSHGISELAGQANSNTNDTASGTLVFTDADLTDTHNVAQSLPAISWSHGNLTGAQESAVAAASTLTLSPTDSTGSGTGAIGFTYSAADGAFDFLAAGETLTVVYNVTVSDGTASATQPVTIVVTGANDAPVLVADTSGPHLITEGNERTGDTGPDTASGSLSFTDLDFTDSHTSTAGTPRFSWSGGSLSTGQQAALAAAGSLVLDELDNASMGTPGTVRFTYSAADSTFDFLAAGQTLLVTYDVTVTDNHSGSSTQPVTIKVTGSNDDPVLAVDTSTHSITERAGLTGSVLADTASGVLSFTDVDLSDTHTSSQSAATFTWSDGPLTTDQQTALSAASTLTLTETDSTGSGAGSLGFNYSAADGAFDFLAAGETLTVSYNVTVTDNHGVASTQPVTITVTGSNDAPVLSADTAVPHSITEGAGQTGSSSVQTASGSLSFSDADLADTHTPSHGDPAFSWSGGTLTTDQQTALAAAGTLALSETDSAGFGAGSVGFTYSAADSAFDFLAAGETLTVTYMVTVTDNHAVASTQPVTITITGTNDAPVAVADAAAVKEDTNPNPATGNVLTNDTDPDTNDTHTVSAVNGNANNVGADVVGTYGTLHLNSDGSYTYTLDNTKASVQALAEGQQVTDVFAYTDTDNHSASSTANLTVTVTGTNDAPVLSIPGHSPLVQENGTVALTGAHVSDVDTGDVQTLTVSVQHGTLTPIASTSGVTVTGDGTGTLILSGLTSAVDAAINSGLTYAPTANYFGSDTLTVSDHDGLNAQAVQQVATIDVNAPPSVTGTLTGSVTEDSHVATSFSLSAVDPDNSVPFTWSLANGSPVNGPGYSFGLDDFQFTKNGASSPTFEDPFSDGIAPPETQNIGTTNSILTGTNDYAVAGSVTESGGRADFTPLNGTVNAASLSPADPFVGQFLTLKTNVDPGNTTNGLKSNIPFSVSGTFDLPNSMESRNSFGIRLTDQATGGSSTNVVDLEVVKGTDGVIHVELHQLDLATGQVSNVTVGSVPLGASVDDSQVVLTLSYAPPTAPATGVVTASFQLLKPDGSGGEVVDATSPVLALGQSVVATAAIFTAENWTQAGAFALAPAHSDTIVQGQYGQLDLTQAGAWTYALDNSSPTVQALGAGQQVQDTFQVNVADANGGTDTKTITVNVHGTNDAPVVNLHVATLSYTENQAPQAIAPAAAVSDIDSANFNGGSLHVSLGETATADDQIGIADQGTGAGQIHVDGGNVYFNNTLIGTESGGANGADLVVNFTDVAATPAATQALLQDIVYSNSSDAPSTAPRTATFTLVDGGGTANGGHDTAVAAAAINVTGVNDPPVVIAGMGDSAGQAVAEANPSIHAAGTLSVQDVDGTDGVTLSEAGVALQLNGHSVSAGSIGLNDVQLLGDFTIPSGNVLSAPSTLAHFNWSFDGAGSDFDFLHGGDVLTLSYTIRPDDGHGTTLNGDGVVTIEIDGNNDAPSGANNTVTTNEDTAYTFAASDFGFSDVDGNALAAVKIATLPGAGVLTDDGNAVTAGQFVSAADINTGKLIFTPDADANGSGYANFTFQVQDDGGTANGGVNTSQTPNTLTVNVTPVNDAPVAQDFSISNATPSGSGWSFDAANDHYYRLVAGPLASQQFGDLGEGTWAEASAIATGDGAYLATITSQAEQSFIESLPGWDLVRRVAWTGGETTNADPIGHSPDSSTWTWIAGPEAGTSFSYTNWSPGEPNGGFSSTTAYSEVEAVGPYLTFGGWNDDPGSDNQAVALEEWGGLAGQIAFREDSSTAFASSVLLANTSDIDSANLSISAVGATSVHGGSVMLNDGIVTYTPSANFNGDDSFTYTVSDGSLTSTATVSFTVAGHNIFNVASGNWSNAADWSLGFVPSTDDAGYIGAASVVTLDGSAGTVAGLDIHVDGTGATLDLSNATLHDTAITTSNGGLVETVGTGSTTVLSGSTHDTPAFLFGSFEVTAGTTLDLHGYVQNAAGLLVDDGATVLIDGTVTLFGQNSVGLGGVNALVTGTDANAKLILENDGISGTGQLGAGQLSIDVQVGAEIASNLSGDGLTIDTVSGSFTNEGLIISNGSGGLVITGALQNTAVRDFANPDGADGLLGIEARDGLVKLEGAVTGGGSAIISGGTLEFDAASDNNVTFQAGTLGHLTLADPAHFSGTISGFYPGDTIDLSSIVYAAGSYATWTQTSVASGGSGSLAIYDASDALQGMFNLNGTYSQANFALQSDGSVANGGNPGTDIVAETAPVATGDNLFVNEGSLPPLGDILKSNDDFGGSDSFTIVSVANALHGTIDLNNGDPIFTPDAGFTGDASFQYSISPAVTTLATVNVSVQAGTDLQGTSGNDVLVAGVANQTLHGNGGADTFVFSAAFNNATIADYHPGTNQLDVGSAIFTDVAALLAATTDDQSGNAVVHLGYDTLTFAHVTTQQLTDHQNNIHIIGTQNLA